MAFAERYEGYPSIDLPKKETVNGYLFSGINPVDNQIDNVQHNSEPIIYDTELRKLFEQGSYLVREVSDSGNNNMLLLRKLDGMPDPNRHLLIAFIKNESNVTPIKIVDFDFAKHIEEIRSKISGYNVSKDHKADLSLIEAFDSNADSKPDLILISAGYDGEQTPILLHLDKRNHWFLILDSFAGC